MDIDRLCLLFGVVGVEDFAEFDLGEESGRIELVERFAPLPVGSPQSRERMALRAVVVNQILDDDPSETWLTTQRLLGEGFDREAVLSQLSLAIGEQVSAALAADARFDAGSYIKALEELPLPEGHEIACCLIEAVRAQPGITAERLFDGTLSAFGSGGGQVLEALVDGVLDDLVDWWFHWLPDDRTVVIPDLVADTIFTHRLTDAEAELGVLTVGLDLGPFSRFDTVRLSDGTVLDQFSADPGHLGWRGPSGWLTDFDPGDLLACSVTIDSSDQDFSGPIEVAVTIEVVVDEPEESHLIVERVRAAYQELVAESDLPVSGDELGWLLLFYHPHMFDAAVQPLSELASAGGLEQRGGSVAHDEKLWRNELNLRRFHDVCYLVSEPEWRRVLGHALDTLDDPDASVNEVRSVLDQCADPDALDVLADVLFGHYLDLSDEFERGGADAPGRLFDLVERATAVAHRPREIATAYYLACVLHERCGNPEEAANYLRRAGEAQPRLGPVVERLGWYLFDRGDAQGAMRWWRTLSVLPDSARTIQPFLSRSLNAPKLGRNDQCWCGAGRKFKHCHQKNTDLPALPDRVGWLCRKATLWLEHTIGDVRATVAEVAMARATGHPEMDPRHFADINANQIDEAFNDPIVLDAALHEGGLFKLFLRERGPLLPEDEQLLAASWQAVDRSVHEVVTVEPGIGMTLRNLATGDVVDVRERTASTQIANGERYCARIVPDGTSNQVIGGVFPVRTGQETTVLDLCASNDPVALCAWVGAINQPPTLVHSPGLVDEMFDRDAIQTVLDDLEDSTDQQQVMSELQAELSHQAQNRWLDEHVPALDGLTPREAATDPTRREQLERLLTEFEANNDRLASLPDSFAAFTYDTAALRNELGLE